MPKAKRTNNSHSSAAVGLVKSSNQAKRPSATRKKRPRPKYDDDPDYKAEPRRQKRVRRNSLLWEFDQPWVPPTIPPSETEGRTVARDCAAPPDDLQFWPRCIDSSGNIIPDVYSKYDEAEAFCTNAYSLVIRDWARYTDFFLNNQEARSQTPLLPTFTTASLPDSLWNSFKYSPEVMLEYPGDDAREWFLLSKATALDNYEYHPIDDVIQVIELVLDCYLTSEQAKKYFNHDPCPYRGAAGGSLDQRFLQKLSSGKRDSSSSDPLDGHGRAPLLKELREAKTHGAGSKFVAAVEHYNIVMRRLKREGAIRQNVAAFKGVPERLWKFISNQCYERAVGPEVHRLSKYESFSDATYGEIESTLMAKIIAQTRLQHDSVFVDLGSGVANCVIQASLATGCRSYGFENAPVPARLAQNQCAEARMRWRMWGLTGGDIHAYAEDMRTSCKVSEALKQADVVLCNNKAFTAPLNQALADQFLDLRDGALIVSLVPFRSKGFRLSPHNCEAVQAMLKQSSEISYDKSDVSWSNEEGSYYIAEVNREGLALARRHLDADGH